MAKTWGIQNNNVSSIRMLALAGSGWFTVTFPKAVNRVVICPNNYSEIIWSLVPNADPGNPAAGVASAVTAATANNGIRRGGNTEPIVLEFAVPINAITLRNNSGAADITVEGHGIAGPET